jgi:hypothetical protein
MLRSPIIVLLLAAASATATATAVAPAIPAQLDVASLFVEQVEQADGTVAAKPVSGMEVLVARIGRDGKPVLACVESAEAAKRFLEAPIDQVARKRKEQ